MTELQNPFEMLYQQLISLSHQINNLECKLESPQNDNNKELLTINEVSELLDLKKQTIYNLCSQKKLPHIKKLGRLYFKKQVVINWLEENSQL